MFSGHLGPTRFLLEHQPPSGEATDESQEYDAGHDHEHSKSFQFAAKHELKAQASRKESHVSETDSLKKTRGGFSVKTQGGREGQLSYPSAG